MKVTVIPMRPSHPKREKAPAPKCGGFLVKIVRRRPTLPQGPPCSTIGAVRLSFRVRNVTGRFPHAMATETLMVSSEQAHFSVMYAFRLKAGNGRCLRTNTVDASKYG